MSVEKCRTPLPGSIMTSKLQKWGVVEQKWRESKHWQNCMPEFGGVAAPNAQHCGGGKHYGIIISDKQLQKTKKYISFSAVLVDEMLFY